MHSCFILLTLLCSATAFNLTYPIKGVYIGFAAVNWNDPGQVIKDAADAGYNLAIITAYSAQTEEMLTAWTSIANKQDILDYAHSYGMAVIMCAWIQKQYGNVIATENATALGISLAAQVALQNLDGIDVVIRDTGPGYTIGSYDSNDSISWVVNLTTALRNNLGPGAVITFSPYASDFGPINGVGTPGALGGYTSITPRISHLINHYNVYFFAVGQSCFVDYESLFVIGPPSCPPGTTVEEISKNANIAMDRVIVTKEIQPIDSGFMNATFLHDAVTTANHSLGWTGGAVGWTWVSADNGTSLGWINEIYPDPNVTIIHPTTTIPTTTTTTTLSTTTTSTTGASTSSPSSTTLSPPQTTSATSGSEINGDCGGNKVQQANGECACAAGYYQSGNSCKKTAIIIIAVIIPVAVVAVIIVLLVFYLRRNRRVVQAKPQRLADGRKGTMSMPELESSYQSTNLVTEYDSIVIKSRLGSGGSGVVNMGVWRHIEVAVKEFSNQDIQTTDFIRESEIHAKLRHPNVVQLLAICLPPHMCTISEYMAKGSLADVLQDKPSSFTWKRKVQALHDIAKGMDYLHSSKIIHRDLKSQNCLVDKNWNCKIADFGTSKLVGDVNQTATAYVPRTAQWSAPEVIVRGEYSEQSDVYSFGVIMWECLTGEIPYDGMFAFQVEDSTVKGLRLPIPEGSDEWFSKLMQQCWSPEPAARPTFGSIITCVEKST